MGIKLAAGLKSKNTTGTSSHLQSLITAGADAFNNLYKATFTVPTSSGVGNYNTFSIRTTSIELPTFTQDEETFNYLTTSVALPKPSYSGSKEITFNLRVDSDYNAYEYLLKLYKSVAVPEVGFASSYLNNNFNFQLDIKVPKSTQGISSAGGMNLSSINFEEDSSLWVDKYSFYNCYIKSITGLSYTYEGTNPESVSVKIAFMEHKIY